MRVLRITAKGLPLFKEKLDISFCAQQRVADDEKEILKLIKNKILNIKEIEISTYRSAENALKSLRDGGTSRNNFV